VNVFNSDPRLPSNKELLILDMLASKKEMYGLEMVQASNGKLARGTIYVTLMRMDDKGYVTSRQVKEGNVSGLPKRVFSLTGLGQRALAAARQAQIMLGGTEVMG
jgi:PadR family transcriptional regulator, regulatory protein PadR